MKTWTMRIFLEGGTIIDKLSTTNDRDAHIIEYINKGVRTSDGKCLVVYPARMIQKVEVYEQGSAPPLSKKDASPPTQRTRRRSTRKDGGDDEEQG